MSSSRNERVVIRETCRACDGPLHLGMTLGPLYLSGFPSAPDAPVRPKIPLDLMVCEGCQLVQLRHTTPFGWMYGQTHYWYRSGINEIMRAELADVAERAAALQEDLDDLTVMDVGANDGTLLRSYPADVEFKIAVEPSHSLHSELKQHCDVLLPDAFPFRNVEGLRGEIDIFTAIACLYDMEDPAGFFYAVATLLAPTGIAIVQFQDLLQMLEASAFDVICHEHLEYYSLWSLLPLIHQAGLQVLDVESRAINGGSLRITMTPLLRDVQQSERVASWIQREGSSGLMTTAGVLARLTEFAAGIARGKRQLCSILDQVKAFNGTIDLFGASTKANTLLQVYELDHSWIRQAIERSPEKFGRYAGQTGIPIVSEEEGRKDPATIALVGVWQFRDGLIRREQEYLARGGRLLFPLPRVEIVGQGRG